MTNWKEPMVYLHKIYTKTGDSGETSLGDGTRVPKTHPRINAYGGVDELNASIGVVLALGDLDDETRQRLLTIQNDLFDLGADLCVPNHDADESRKNPALRVTAQQVERLETWIDEATACLRPLESFILPGGTPAAALLHQARTICRRAEIGLLHLSTNEAITPQSQMYLNRLSDLLFVLARMANDCGQGDILWKPGESQQRQ